MVEKSDYRRSANREVGLSIGDVFFGYPFFFLVQAESLACDFREVVYGVSDKEKVACRYEWPHDEQEPGGVGQSVLLSRAR